jgi:hypothetical protein
MRHLMKACLFFLLPLIITAVIAGCGKKHYQPTAVDREADKEAELFWSKAFSKCGDSYYGEYSFSGRHSTSSPMIYQLKEPFIFTYHDMDEKVITEADKLNGFEWQGTTTVFSKVYRYTMSDKWVDWSDGSPLMRSTLRIPIRKVKGKWEFGISESDDQFLAIPCSQVPN